MRVTNLLLTSSIFSTSFNLLKMNPIRSIKQLNLSVSTFRRSTSSFTTDSIENSAVGSESTSNKVWNLKNIKFDVRRLCNRTFQKLSVVTNSELAFENTAEGKLQLANKENLQHRLRLLNDLEEQLKTIKSPSGEQFTALLPVITSLGITPSEPIAPVIKAKPTPPGPRLPYHIYKSVDDIEIWVGRNAEDNDDLSCNPKLRHNDEWWMHAAGHAGSHVVIKCKDDDLPTKYRQTVLDAAYLAAVNSKAPTNGRRNAVTLTRCRQVHKTKGAVAGLVQLNGDLITVSITPKIETDRRDRLKRV